ncbi:MAG: hypothetical protein EBZ47_00010 [Chlamydiae bacterium]|nr:hypothetical protein [Chlamydiota bacterium]
MEAIKKTSLVLPVLHFKEQNQASVLSDLKILILEKLFTMEEKLSSYSVKNLYQQIQENHQANTLTHLRRIIHQQANLKKFTYSLLVTKK